jgi:hypothetical protein
MKKYKLKATRLFDKNLYSLDLTNNFIDQQGIEILTNELFNVDPSPIEFFS